MTDGVVKDGVAVSTDSNRDPTEDQLEELRGLLLAPEQAHITGLQRRLDDLQIPAEKVSLVLPEAINQRSKKDKQLTTALLPTVEEAISVSVKRDPQRLVDAIFPVMGPAIRKAISHALNEVLQSLNQTLEYSVSIKGMKWRLEALRTGKSFAEVVLRHTLLFRVEQVFLIHKATGLLLHHVSIKPESEQDADLISGMLTAIQDFVQDSFGAAKDDALESFQVGDLNIWIEQGAQAVLAAVFRGNAPQELRRTMQDALDTIHFDHRELLADFDGDTAPFETTRPQLANCLQMQLESKAKPASSVLRVVIGLVLLALSVWLFFYIRGNLRWRDYVNRLRAEPGIVIISEEKSGGQYHIMGLRDPLAVEPNSLLPAARIEPSSVVSRWENFFSSHPQIVRKRAQEILQPPDSVVLEVDGNTIVASGIADRQWIREAGRTFRLIPGLSEFQSTQLIESEMVRSQIADIENLNLQFEVGKAEIRPGYLVALQQTAARIKTLQQILQSVGKDLRISLIGSSDETGSERLNEGLRKQRAQAVFNLLTANGIEGKTLIPFEGKTLPQATLALGRSVTCKIEMLDSPLPKR